MNDDKNALIYLADVRIGELQAENAKLRELCVDMCHLLPHADWPSTKCDEKASACIDQAIELGIEADE